MTASAVQPDGKVVIAGSFGPANGFQQSGVARLLANGQTDRTFQPAALFNGSYSGFVYDLKCPAGRQNFDCRRITTATAKPTLLFFAAEFWDLQQSASGFTGIQFGSTGDRPVPNAFVP